MCGIHPGDTRGFLAIYSLIDSACGSVIRSLYVLKNGKPVAYMAQKW